MLIITNGDSAVESLRGAGIEGDYLPWRDVLHEGPIPDGLDLPALSSVRAIFLASLGVDQAREIEARFRERDANLESFRSHSEVLLWFEHDLYDQLQMLQVLDWFSRRELGATRLTLICQSKFVAETPGKFLGDLFEQREEVSSDILEEAWRAWSALRTPEPEPLVGLAKASSSRLRYLGVSLRRLLEEYPAPATGLARSERQILESLVPEPLTPAALFERVSRLEEAAYLGDWWFYHLLKTLMSPSHPLIKPTRTAAEAFDPRAGRAWRDEQVSITGLGKDVLAGKQDWVKLSDLNKWLGGVHLRPGKIWRWDPTTSRLTRDRTTS